jgi:uncharacterized protein
VDIYDKSEQENIAENRIKMIIEGYIQNNKMLGKNIILSKKVDFELLCKQYKVKNLYLFGSALRDDFDEKTSDFDFLVNFKKEEIKIEDYADNYFDFLYSLEALLDRKVDIQEEKAIKNPLFKQRVEATKQLIYA